MINLRCNLVTIVEAEVVKPSGDLCTEERCDDGAPEPILAERNCGYCEPKIVWRLTFCRCKVVFRILRR